MALGQLPILIPPVVLIALWVLLWRSARHHRHRDGNAYDNGPGLARDGGERAAAKGAGFIAAS